jgi:hypothetical protein
MEKYQRRPYFETLKKQEERKTDKQVEKFGIKGSG